MPQIVIGELVIWNVPGHVWVPKDKVGEIFRKYDLPYPKLVRDVKRLLRRAIARAFPHRKIIDLPVSADKDVFSFAIFDTTGTTREIWRGKQISTVYFRRSTHWISVRKYVQAEKEIRAYVRQHIDDIEARYLGYAIKMMLLRTCTAVPLLGNYETLFVPISQMGLIDRAQQALEELIALRYSRQKYAPLFRLPIHKTSRNLAVLRRNLRASIKTRIHELYRKCYNQIIGNTAKGYMYYQKHQTQYKIKELRRVLYLIEVYETALDIHMTQERKDAAIIRELILSMAGYRGENALPRWQKKKST